MASSTRAARGPHYQARRPFPARVRPPFADRCGSRTRAPGAYLTQRLLPLVCIMFTAWAGRSSFLRRIRAYPSRSRMSLTSRRPVTAFAPLAHHRNGRAHVHRAWESHRVASLSDDSLKSFERTKVAASRGGNVGNWTRYRLATTRRMLRSIDQIIASAFTNFATASRGRSSQHPYLRLLAASNVGPDPPTMGGINESGRWQNGHRSRAAHR